MARYRAEPHRATDPRARARSHCVRVLAERRVAATSTAAPSATPALRGSRPVLVEPIEVELAAVLALRGPAAGRQVRPPVPLRGQAPQLRGGCRRRPQQL